MTVVHHRKTKSLSEHPTQDNNEVQQEQPPKLQTKEERDSKISDNSEQQNQVAVVAKRSKTGDDHRVAVVAPGFVLPFIPTQDEIAFAFGQSLFNNLHGLLRTLERREQTPAASKSMSPQRITVVIILSYIIEGRAANLPAEDTELLACEVIMRLEALRAAYPGCI